MRYNDFRRMESESESERERGGGAEERNRDEISRKLFNEGAEAIIIATFIPIPWTPRRLIEEGCDGSCEHAAVLLRGD